MTPVTIAGIPIGDGHPCRVVAEIGVNHQGSTDIAKGLMYEAKQAGADFVKFQIRTPELSVPKAEWSEPRDTPWGYQLSKLEYRKRVEFSDENWKDIGRFADHIGIRWFCSVWDVPALERLHNLPVDFIAVKIPSARLHDDALLKAAARYGRPVILSTGMSEWKEVQWAWGVLRNGFDLETKTPWRLRPAIIPMQCTSNYPSRHDECNLRVIQTYKREFGCPVGFSSHKIGIQTVVLSVAVGANLVERHISFDRSWLGSDHKISTTPCELVRMIREIRYAEASLGDGVKTIYASELPERKRLSV